MLRVIEDILAYGCCSRIGRLCTYCSQSIKTYLGRLHVLSRKGVSAYPLVLVCMLQIKSGEEYLYLNNERVLCTIHIVVEVVVVVVEKAVCV